MDPLIAATQFLNEAVSNISNAEKLLGKDAVLAESYHLKRKMDEKEEDSKGSMANQELRSILNQIQIIVMSLSMKLGEETNLSQEEERGTYRKKHRLEFENRTKNLDQKSLEVRDETSKTTQFVKSEYKDFREPNEKDLNQSRNLSGGPNQLSHDGKCEIIRKIETVQLPPGMKITNYIFVKCQLEVYYLLEEDVSCDENVLREQLSGHLGLNQNSIKLTKLSGEPIYKETLGPGETLSVGGKTCAIGAMVNIEGKGIHALMAGHGKRRGDMVHSNAGNPVGTVNVAMSGTGVQNGPNDNIWCLHRDIAVARLANPGDYVAHVNMQGVNVGLEEDPIEAEDEMRVRRYTADGREGVTGTFVRKDPITNVLQFLLDVRGDDEGPIHAEGESGTLIVKHDDSGDIAAAVGMLTEIAQLPADPTRESSLAVHLTTNFQALQVDPYCRGSQIQFSQI